jgi:hypothetical protein
MNAFIPGMPPSGGKAARYPAGVSGNGNNILPERPLK